MGAVLDGGEVHLAVLQDAAVVVVGVSYPAAVAAVHALQQAVVQGAVAGGRALSSMRYAVLALRLTRNQSMSPL